MPASSDAVPMLPGLSPIHGRAVEARFDAALMSWDDGVLALREIERRTGLAARLAGCIADPRAPERIARRLDEIIRFRMLVIAAGYEAGNDADSLLADPLLKLAMERLPDHADLCSQPTVSRTENLPDRHALLRMGRAMVDHDCQSFRQVPRRAAGLCALPRAHVHAAQACRGAGGEHVSARRQDPGREAASLQGLL